MMQHTPVPGPQEIVGGRCPDRLRQKPDVVEAECDMHPSAIRCHGNI